MASYSCYTVLLVLCVFAIAQPLQAKKDVLFITIDDLRIQLSAYGEKTAITPTIDAFANKSLVFDRAYCQVAVCSPSRASLLTGRRPDTNHVWKISPAEYWRTFTNATTIPQYFKENGYTSIGMGKIFHPGAESRHDDTTYSWSLPYFHGRDTVDSPNSWSCFFNISDNALTDGQVADKAVETLKAIKQNRTKGNNTPFFLAVGFHKPHLPFFAPSKYCDMYPMASEFELAKNPDAPTNMPPIAWSTSAELKTYEDMSKYRSSDCARDANASMHGDTCRVTDTDARVLRKLYNAALSYIDAQLGRVLAELKSQELNSNIVIVLLGDHGYKLGEHNMWAKSTNLEIDTRVPLMLQVPSVTDSGMRTSALVELIDLFPSLTELAGLKVPPLCPENNTDILACVEGTSVAPLLKDPKQEWKKAAFSQFARPTSGLNRIPNKPPFDPDNLGEDVMGYSIRLDLWRFVEWYSFNRTSATPDFNTIWGTELYNHTLTTEVFNDDNVNLAADPKMSVMVQDLKKVLQAGWRKAMPPQTQL